ncbi:MAG: diguanylate cyclase [Paenibacillaceae bacterium]|nr:diguanylate cyclase [Paenibacillaceae bacterium]
MKRMGRWAISGFMMCSSLVWLWLGLAESNHRWLMLACGGLQVLAGFGMGMLYDRVRALSLRDDLTTAYNRRFLARAMPSLLSRLARQHRILTVTLIDCDDFKKINDQNGHHAGDIVLRGISRLLIENIRREDYVVRWGGDEFLLIANDADIASTRSIVDRLNGELATMSLSMNMPLSVSSGTAAFPEDATRLEDLIRIADQRMYHTKLMRKNLPPASSELNKRDALKAL